MFEIPEQPIKVEESSYKSSPDLSFYGFTVDVEEFACMQLEKWKNLHICRISYVMQYWRRQGKPLKGDRFVPPASPKANFPPLHFQFSSQQGKIFMGKFHKLHEKKMNNVIGCNYDAIMIWNPIFVRIPYAQVCHIVDFGFGGLKTE